MFQRKADKLRRELDGVKSRQGRCFSGDLKERTEAWLTEQRAAGVGVAELASTLGLSEGTVLRWTKARRTSGTRALVPVEVVADVVGSRTVSVVSPSGFRIEALSLVDAVAVLKELT